MSHFQYKVEFVTPKEPALASVLHRRFFISYEEAYRFVVGWGSIAHLYRRDHTAPGWVCLGSYHKGVQTP